MWPGLVVITATEVVGICLQGVSCSSWGSAGALGAFRRLSGGTITDVLPLGFIFCCSHPLTQSWTAEFWRWFDQALGGPCLALAFVACSVSPCSGSHCSVCHGAPVLHRAQEPVCQRLPGPGCLLLPRALPKLQRDVWAAQPAPCQAVYFSAAISSSMANRLLFKWL